MLQTIPPSNQRPPQSINAYPKGPFTVIGIPSNTIQNNRQLIGGSESTSSRSFTILKTLGDGSFGTVWLCDWHGSLPPNTPPAAMQSGTCRPEWVGKRLVALKRMKKLWEGGWDECQKLKELESLRAIPVHPNIVPLYDFFLTPMEKELYFAFEPMEGNLYHLIKSRRGRPLVGGLVSSIFRQIVNGLHHIHASGYFHRDMKPENILVTTTGHFDYTSVSPLAGPNTPKERDVVTIIKLADFGLARETKSKPPYTEYVSTRWYRAPEVLLLSRDYSNPVDMWALGTIMAELVNLRPLFPGQDQMEQLLKICDVLGDPSDEYGVDPSTGVIGGGPWPRGIKMGKSVGFVFPKVQPKDINLFFDPNVPRSLIQCIRDLLRYNPDARLTSRQCLDHPYLLETSPRNHIPMLASLESGVLPLPPSQHPNGSHSSIPSLTPRNVPHSHPHSVPIPDASSSHRNGYYPPHYNGKTPVPWNEVNGGAQANGHSHTDYPMENAPQPYHPEPNGYLEHPQDSPHAVNGQANQPQPSKLGVFSSLSFGKKNGKRSFGMFGGDKSNQLPPVDEMIPPVPTLKRTQTSSSDGRLQDLSAHDTPARNAELKKINKKEAERMQREAEEQKRKIAAKMHREQARAVMQKRNQVMQKAFGNDIEWLGGNEQRLDFSETSKPKQAASGPIRKNQTSANAVGPSTTLNAAGGRFGNSPEPPSAAERRGTTMERLAKARRREFDDDHSMSSSDVHSLGHVSSISFATVDSDPGPSRLRTRPSLFSINRMTSMSSLRTSVDEFPPSARSSNSFSLEGQLAHDFRTQATVNSPHLAGSVSPPPMHLLSLSPSVSPSLSPSPPWVHVQHQQHKDGLSPRREQSPPFVTLQNGYNTFEHLHGHPPSPYGQPPSPLALAPGTAPKSAINPIFKVVSYKWDSRGGLVPDLKPTQSPPPPPLPTEHSLNQYSPTALPPFSQLEAVAGGGESPMSYTRPPEGS
ncbi:Pkinase-domain-containing protein [Pluteus cervinus]|uniref:Pkinase-domain-containing protein n=1 Tax=Pluteus cervinus TaxID=181527 RepID=A0ACD3BGZ5_9AGAR|nr:Pkinase-domain-containing protein [Pluteus cervinus]